MFNKLVKDVEINITKKLAGQVADGQAVVFIGIPEAFMRRNKPVKMRRRLFVDISPRVVIDNLLQKSENPFFFNVLF